MGQKNIIGKLSVSSTVQNLTSGSKFARLEENKLHIEDQSSFKWADCGINGISIGSYDDGATLQPMKLMLSTAAETVTYDMDGVIYGYSTNPTKLLFPNVTGTVEITPAFYDGYGYQIGGQEFQINQYKIGIYSSLNSSKLALTEDEFDGVDYKIHGIEHYHLNRQTYETSTYTYNFPDESGTLATREWVGNEALNFLKSGNNGGSKTLSFISDENYGATYNSAGISITNYDEPAMADFDAKLDVYALQFTVWNDPNSMRAKYGEEGILIGPGGRLDSGVQLDWNGLRFDSSYTLATHYNIEGIYHKDTINLNPDDPYDSTEYEAIYHFPYLGPNIDGKPPVGTLLCKEDLGDWYNGVKPRLYQHTISVNFAYGSEYYTLEYVVYSNTSGAWNYTASENPAPYQVLPGLVDQNAWYPVAGCKDNDGAHQDQVVAVKRYGTSEIGLQYFTGNGETPTEHTFVHNYAISYSEITEAVTKDSVKQIM